MPTISSRISNCLMWTLSSPCHISTRPVAASKLPIWKSRPQNGSYSHWNIRMGELRTSMLHFGRYTWCQFSYIRIFQSSICDSSSDDPRKAMSSRMITDRKKSYVSTFRASILRRILFYTDGDYLVCVRPPGGAGGYANVEVPWRVRIHVRRELHGFIGLSQATFFSLGSFSFLSLLIYARYYLLFTVYSRGSTRHM